MKYLFSIISPITILICLSLTISSLKANAMDINLGGDANLNINNANNNKLTTPLKNFSPVDVPQSQVDLAPLATPPTSGSINYFGGNKINTDIVDRDVKNANEAKNCNDKLAIILASHQKYLQIINPLKMGILQTF